MWFKKKEKTKLQLLNESVADLVKKSNDLIYDLGKQDSILYQALVEIQEKFDLIRNVPNEEQLKYQEVKKVSHSWKQQVDYIYNDFESAKNAEIGSGAAGGALGVGVATLGPTAAMGVATTFGVASTGTAISSLSGAAATNAALAWLGGGTLAAGGGGMAAGQLLLTLAGPVGWAIAGTTIVASVALYLWTKSEKDRLEELFLLIGERDKCSYKMAIVELNERIKRVIDETKKLYKAIGLIESFGTDYNSMTEVQQYTLGTYVNLMYSSTQLLVNPIQGLQPKFTLDTLERYITFNTQHAGYCKKEKELIVYMANLLYGIDTTEHDRKLLSKSFKNNKDFMKKMKLEKKYLDVELFNVVDEVLKNCK